MTSKTLRFHIGSLLTGLLLGTTMVVLMVVWLSTEQLAKTQVKKELTTGINVIERLLSNREDSLAKAAEVLATDLTFLQTATNVSHTTIKNHLINHSNRVDADFIAILDVNGATQVTVGGKNQQDHLKRIARLVLTDGVVTTVAIIDNRLYQLALIAVNAPSPMAIAVIGLEIDTLLANELKELIGLDVSFIWNDVDNDNDLTEKNAISTTTDIDIVALENNIDNLSWRLPFSYPQPLQSNTYLLNKENNISVYLSIDLHQIFTGQDYLQLKLSLVAILSLFISLLTASFFSRKITRPLQKISETVTNIASGGHPQTRKIDAETVEVKDLVKSIKKMQSCIFQREKEIEYRATHDTTTGLINRTAFIEKVESFLISDKKFQIIGFGINNIRQISNMFGPAIGQLSLKKISDYLSDRFVCVARSSDERFMAMVDYDVSIDDIHNLHTSLKIKLQESLAKDGVHLNAEIFTGTIPYGNNSKDVDSLIRKLDITMDSGCTTEKEVCLYQPGQETAYLDRLRIVEDLRLSIKNKGSGLAMYYQPKLNLRTGQVNKMEALIRWQHTEQGFIPPDTFIPLAEQSGLINVLTEWIIETVIIQITRWITAGYKFEVAINLSAQDIARPEMLSIIKKLLLHHNVPSEMLSFEITESEIMSKPEEAIRLLSLFRQQSFKLAIDDFGTGYSSLAQLKNMPVTELKIDREFVMNLAKNPDDKIIVQSTIDLASSFNLGVVAEGVEDIETLHLLADLNCDWAQGYFIARPMAGDDVINWLNEFNEKNVYSGADVA
jgi:EAL domain-containing protein (putative c-di-GMP-specific phosphodiesterase class I)/GGDEF domain-containing protein